MARAPAGFSLVELVLVLVLIGILAVFVVPRINIGGFDSGAFRDEMVAAFRHAQRLAMASGCPIQVSVSGGEYSVAWTGDGGSACQPAGPVAHPSRGGALSGSGPATSEGQVVFDGMGRVESGLAIGLEDGQQIIVEGGSGHVRTGS